MIILIANEYFAVGVSPIGLPLWVNLKTTIIFILRQFWKKNLGHLFWKGKAIKWHKTNAVVGKIKWINTCDYKKARWILKTCELLWWSSPSSFNVNSYYGLLLFYLEKLLLSILQIGYWIYTLDGSKMLRWIQIFLIATVCVHGD